MLTYSDIEEFDIRKKKLEYRYIGLLDLVSGADEVYWDASCDTSLKNHISEEFLTAMELYHGYRFQLESTKSLLDELEPVQLSDEDKELYGTFFDTVTNLAVYNEPGEISWLGTPGTWRAVIERIKYPLSYKTADELHKDLIIWNEIIEEGKVFPGGKSVPEGIFYSLSCAYTEVTGEKLSSLLTKPQRKAAMALMTEKELKYLEVAQKHDEKLSSKIRQEQNREEELFYQQITDDEIEKRFAGHEDVIKSIKDLRNQLERLGNPTSEQMHLVQRVMKKSAHKMFDSLGIPRGDASDWRVCFDSEGVKTASKLLLEKGVEMYNRRHFQEDCVNALYLALSSNGIGSWLDKERFYAVHDNMREAISNSNKTIEEIKYGNKR